MRDFLVTAAILVLALAAYLRTAESEFAASGGALSLLVVASAALLLLVRRAFPTLVWTVCLALAVFDTLRAGGPTPTLLPALVALFALASTVSFGRAAAAAVANALVLSSAIAITRWTASAAYAAVGWSGMLVAIAVALKGHRALLAAAEERARRAEQTRDEEAQRRVAEERLRIARELHDVVAHHISVINVQAGVAQHLLATEPDEAEHALSIVRSSSQTVISELSSILGLFRSSLSDAPLQPAPGLDRVDELVAAMRHAGLATQLVLGGTPIGLSPVVDVTAFRIIQEALTNAHKHGTGSAVVRIAYEGTQLSIQVENPMRPTSATEATSERPHVGLGIAGMRERVTAVGGQLAVGAGDAHTWHVRASLPGEPV